MVKVFVQMAVALVGAADAAFMRYAPVTFQGPGAAAACASIKCAPVQCKPPFKWVNAEESGTCCPTCQSAIAAEDRSWTTGLTGGQGPDANADQLTCKGAFCPTLTCAPQDQYFETAAGSNDADAAVAGVEGFDTSLDVAAGETDSRRCCTRCRRGSAIDRVEAFDAAQVSAESARRTASEAATGNAR